MGYIDVTEMFIRAERTGNWDEHLEAPEILSLHAATGHFNYTKSTKLHLQTMLRLKMTFLGYIDNLKKMNFIAFGAQTNTGQGFGQI